MALAFPEIAERRAAALRKWFRTGDLPPVIAVETAALLPAHPAEGGGSMERLGRRREKNVVIWKKASPDASSVWVQQKYRGYRAAYVAFIKRFYGSVDMSGLADYDIDHLFAKGQKRATGKYVRLEASLKPGNRQHGATVEKDQARQINRKRRTHDHFSFISVLKLAGLHAPKGPNDRAQIRRIVQHFVAEGWTKAEVEQAIDNLIRLYKR